MKWDKDTDITVWFIIIERLSANFHWNKRGAQVGELKKKKIRKAC